MYVIVTLWVENYNIDNVTGVYWNILTLRLHLNLFYLVQVFFTLLDFQKNLEKFRAIFQRLCYIIK